jgi:adenosylcobinamide-GDP ribazoletransferase
MAPGSPLAAIAFLTRFPLRRQPSLDDVSRSQAWFAAVGLLIGLALWAIDRVTMRALPDDGTNALIVVALAGITGALHLDGLADTADGLAGGHLPERRLAIMRDVRVGTYGVVAIVAVFGLKWAGLASLPSDARVEAIILAPCLARLGVVAAIAAYPYARAEGMGAWFHERAWPLAFAVCTLTAGAAAVALFGAGGVLLLVFSLALALAFGALVTRLAGGMSGDSYGATIEIGEALVLLFAAALANRGWLDAWLLA